MNTATQPVVRTLRWTESIVPRGCRNPRDVDFTHETTLTVRAVTGEQAPVVLRVHEGARSTDYRGLDGQLYISDTEWNVPYGRHSSFDDAERAAQASLNEQLLIEGTYWSLAHEPVYEVVDGYRRSGSLYVRVQAHRDPAGTSPTDDVYSAADTAAIDALTDQDTTVSFWSTIEVLEPAYVTLPPKGERIAAERVAVLTGLHALGLRLTQITDPAMTWEAASALRKDLTSVLDRATNLGLR